MRVLGIETSSRRGTVALVEDGRAVATLGSEEPMPGERMLPLLDALFSAAGWAKSSIDRVATGIGPGSFTGLRMGVALGQGLGLGFGRPVVGVSSVRAMCRGVPAETPGIRCALLDARRDELFAGVYGPAGEELVGPLTVPRAGISAWLALLPTPPTVLVGEILAELGLPLGTLRSELTDLPHAIAVALAGFELEPELAPPEPAYVRPADAIRPNLPRSPLSSGQPR